MRKFGKVLSLLAVAVVVLALFMVAGFRTSAWWREAATPEALAPANGRFVQTDRGTIHVSVWGADNPKTVVMTHGMAPGAGCGRKRPVSWTGKGIAS